MKSKIRLFFDLIVGIPFFTISGKIVKFFDYLTETFNLYARNISFFVAIEIRNDNI